MIITIAGMKGGVGKTTTAIQIAGNLSDSGSTVLIDGDPNQSALGWARRSTSLPFEVIGLHKAVSVARNFEHIVMDTKARPRELDGDYQRQRAVARSDRHFRGANRGH